MGSTANVVMDQDFYARLAQESIEGGPLSQKAAQDILASPDLELLPLLNAAYTVRRRFTGKEVSIHIIDNVQNGFCPEDCRYCAQSRSSQAGIEEYALKSDEEILAEAGAAYEKGAACHCMVFAGRGPSEKRIQHLARLIRQIKSRYPMEVCVSTGILDAAKARTLKEAGLDRLNHNLNTAERLYSDICTTHTYTDRLNTLKAAREAGLRLCSGVIIGMGETPEDIFDMAMTLRAMNAESIPVNFYIPVDGNALQSVQDLSPEYCLRVLCLFRLLNPQAEIRVAAGRELYLRRLQVMAFYPANSIFLDGYLNTQGEDRSLTLQMIRDAGFAIRCEHSLEDPAPPRAKAPMKGLRDLRPYYEKIF